MATLTAYDKGTPFKVLVDDGDYSVLSQHRWKLDKGGYVRRNIRLRDSLGRKTISKNISLHRTILGINDRNIDVDHINGNRLDNRRINLRLCTRSENLRNRTARNKSGIKGVYWIVKKRKWRVQMMVNYKVHRFGEFSSLQEAASVCISARRMLHGKFASEAEAMG